jgi:integrase
VTAVTTATAVAPAGPSPFAVDWSGWQHWLREQVDPGWRPGEWDERWWLFTGDADNPRTSVWKCRSPQCTSGIYSRRGRCHACQRDHREAGVSWEEFDRRPLKGRKLRDGHEGEECLVVRDGWRCGRSGHCQGLCLAHYSTWTKAPAGAPDAAQWAHEGHAAPFPAPPPCSVGGCSSKAMHERTVLCVYHLRRWKLEQKLPARDTAAALAWAARQPPVLTAYRFSLIELTPLLRLEVAYGLQQRDELGSPLDPRSLRQIVPVLARHGTSLVSADDQLAGHFTGQLNPHAVFRQVSWSARRGYAGFAGFDPWGEDRLDLRAVGLKSTSRTGRRRQAGVADLSAIPQPWLRDLLRRWAEAERPASDKFGRRLRAATRAGAGMNRLPGGGRDLAALDFSHMQAAFDEIASDRRRDGKLSGSKFRSDLLTAFFQLLDFGRFAKLMEEVPGSFARHNSHRIPREDLNEEELGKAIPEPVLAQLDAALDTLAAGTTYGDLSPAEIQEMFRTLYVVLRDCGRRPLEVVSLPRHCLEITGEDVELIWDNHKGRRLRRRLPLSEETVATIQRWQQIRDRIPAPPHSDDYLFPAISHYSGVPHMNSVTLSTAIRTWVDGLPELHSDVVGLDGTLAPFDRSLIFPYAFRHSFAQRYADAGTPLDVLQALMDHDDPKTTTGYYRITLERKREAVKKVARLVTDRHGTAKPCSPDAYEHQSVAVPFGGCTEPSNVKAGGQACPLRFQCSGCSFYRPDPSYLPAIEDHVNSLRADRETAQAMDAARFVVDNLTAEITSFQDVAATMRTELADMPEAERAEVEEAASVLRKVRSGSTRPLLPLITETRTCS